MTEEMTKLETFNASTDIIQTYRRGIRVGEARSLDKVITWMTKHNYPVGDQEDLGALLLSLAEMAAEAGDASIGAVRLEYVADEDMAAFLKDVVGCVEADSYARYILWREWTGRNDEEKWKSELSGRFVQIGTLSGMPVMLELWTSVVDEHKILFFNSTSQVVDHRMVDKWLEQNLPKSAFRPGEEFVNRTDATNFHNVFPD